MNISEALAKRIADHLKAVESKLAALPGDERRDILQSVETHIYDALGRVCGDIPSLADLEAVVAAMDPPESYLSEVTVANRRNVFRPILYAVIVLAVAGAAFLLSRRSPGISAPPEKDANTRASIGSQQMSESESLRTGVLHACISKTGQSDIFLSDPIKREWQNLTKGRVSKPGWGQAWEPVGSPDGKTVVLRIYRWTDNREMRTQIWLLDIDRDRLSQVPGEFGFVMGFSWSPDSTRFVCFEDDALMVIRRDGQGKKVIAETDSKIGGCSWSPRGDAIAYTSADGSLRIAAPEGSSSRILVRSGIHDDPPCWGRNGDRIAVIANGLISVVSLEGSVIKQYGQANAIHGWSADGNLLAYGTRDGIRQIHIVSLDDGTSRPVDYDLDATSGLWMPLDNQLVFWGKNDENRDYSLIVCESDGGNPRIFGKAHTAGFMAPTLLGKDLISGSAAEGHNPRTAPAEAAHLAPPVVVSTIPQSGDMHVDPNVGRISVTFDKDMMMDRMWSWCMHSAETFPEISNQKGIKYLADKRTCVLPVKLKPNKTYVIWINTQKNNAFRDTSGHPAIPYLLVFKTH